jgi:hypothetical protein
MKKMCEAFTKSGIPCKAPAISGSRFCFFHSDPERARRLGRDGGRKNRRLPTNVEVPEHLDLSGVPKVLEQTLRALVSGEIDSRTAVAVTTVCGALQRSMPLSELQDRLTALEQKQVVEDGTASQSVVTVDSGANPAGNGPKLAKDAQDENTSDKNATAETAVAPIAANTGVSKPAASTSTESNDCDLENGEAQLEDDGSAPPKPNNGNDEL